MKGGTNPENSMIQQIVEHIKIELGRSKGRNDNKLQSWQRKKSLSYIGID